MKKKIGKFGFLKNGAGIGENAYQVRYGSLEPSVSCLNFKGL